MSNYIIDLTNETPIAQGAEHFIFQHPDYPDRLIKVMKPSSKRHVVKRPSVRRFKSLRIWHREMSEYLAALAHGGRHCSRLARQFGVCETSRGLGLIVERLQGPDGELAPTLRVYLKTARKDPVLMDALQADGVALFEQLREFRVDWEDMTRDNVVVTGGDTPRLSIIDGLGTPALIPLTHLSDRLFLRANKLRLARFLQMIGS